MAHNKMLVATSGKSHLSNADKQKILDSIVEVDNKTELIVLPKFLTNKRMKDKFKSLVDELTKAKIFTHLDVDILGQYCYDSIMFEDICKQLCKLPVSSDEFIQLNKEKIKIQKQLEISSKQLGIGFLNRSKMQLPVAEVKKESKFGRFMGEVK